MKNKVLKLAVDTLLITKTILFSLIFSIVVLHLFSFVYNYTGYNVSDENGATDFRWNANSFMSTMREGHAWKKMDSNGYNNLSIPNNIDILLMGSSHIEADQIASQKNISVLLNNMFNNLNVYNIGISGHNIYVNVDNYENALKRFNPKNIQL